MSPSELDSLISNLKKLPGEFKTLVEKRIELFTIELGERIAGLIANAMYRIMGIVFLSLGMILLLFATAKFVGDLLGSESLGFVVVSAPMLLIGLLFFLRRPRGMVIRTRDKMVQQFMDELSDQLGQSDNDEKKQDDNKGNPVGTEPGSNKSTDDREKSTG